MDYVAIGDIHGCKETLAALLEKMAPKPDEILVFIGDYIDRGPDSKGVIDLLLEIKQKQRCIFLRGNHEQMMLDARKNGDYSLWLANGGRETLESYIRAGEDDMTPEHLQFIEETEFHFQTEDFLFVHGGLKPRLPIEENLTFFDPEVFLWERTHLRIENVWEKTVICGHTPQPHILMKPNLICIDTGCVFTFMPQFGTLSAIRLPSREVIELHNCEKPPSDE